MAEGTPVTYSNAAVAIEAAVTARDKMEDAYTDAFDEFSAVEQAYRKFFGTTAAPTDVVGIVKKFAPVALKYFGAGGAGAGVLLALAQDGTGAGILSRIGGIFGIGGP